MSCGEHGHMKIEIFSVNFESTNLIEEKESNTSDRSVS